MKYSFRPRKLFVKLLEERNAPGVLLDFPFLAGAESLGESQSQWLQSKQTVDSRVGIAQIPLEQISTSKPKPSPTIRTNEIRQEVRSPFSFSLDELNDVLKNALLGNVATHQAIAMHPFTVDRTASTSDYHDNSIVFTDKNYSSICITDNQSQQITLSTSNALYSLMSAAGSKSKVIQDNPTPNWGYTEYGNIRIDCTTTPATGGNPEGILGAC